jgi:hypothetical protein
MTPYHKKLKEVFGKTTLSSLLVDGWKIMTCLLHNFDYAVKRDAVMTIGIHGVEIGIKGARSSVGIALNTGDLNKATYGVAGHTEVVFKTHLGSILNLGWSTTK